MNDISNVKVHLRTRIGNLNTCIALSLVLSWCSSNMSLVMRKPALCICNCQLISAFVFAIRIIQSLYYLHPKFQASSHLLWLYSPVCVGPCQKPWRPVFSQRGSYLKSHLVKMNLYSCKLLCFCFEKEMPQSKTKISGSTLLLFLCNFFRYSFMENTWP